MDSQRWSQRGKKLFLPKIEYNRLENSTESWSTGKVSYNSAADEFVVQQTIENNEFEKVISPSADVSDRNGISFTKFSVLPPIQGNKTSSKGISSHRRQFSDAVLSEEELCYKRKGSSLHRQTAVLTPDREPITLQKTNTDNLKIVGKTYSGLNNTRAHHQTTLITEDHVQNLLGNSRSRPSTTPNSSQPFVSAINLSRPFSDSENDNVYSLTSNSSPGLIPKNYRGRLSAGRRLSKFRRFNSDTSNEGKQESLEKNTNHSLPSRDNMPQVPSLLSPFESSQKGNEKGVLSSSCRSPRPISRCHIDINMNESESISFNSIADRKVSMDEASDLFDTTLSADVRPSAPLIQISTEQCSSTEERRESQDSPSIQILINSLDSAKEKPPEDEKTEEHPKLSVREQRRRSALCRANSKQVDDFLLVHNLRDLGLL